MLELTTGSDGAVLAVRAVGVLPEDDYRGVLVPAAVHAAAIRLDSVRS